MIRTPWLGPAPRHEPVVVEIVVRGVGAVLIISYLATFISAKAQLQAPSQEPSDVKVLEVPSRDISLQNFTQWQTDVIVSPGPSLFAAPQFAGADIFS